MKTSSLMSLGVLLSALGSGEGFSAEKLIDSIKVIGKVELNVQEGSAFAIDSSGSVKVSYEKGESGAAEKLVIEAKDLTSKVSVRLPKLLALELSKGAVAQAELKASEAIRIQAADGKLGIRGSVGKMELSSSHSEIDLSLVDIARAKISSNGDSIRLNVHEVRGALHDSKVECVKVPKSADFAKVNATVGGCG